MEGRPSVDFEWFFEECIISFRLYCFLLCYSVKMSMHAISNSGSIVEQRDCEGILMDNNDAPGVVEWLHNRQRVEWR